MKSSDGLHSELMQARRSLTAPSLPLRSLSDNPTTVDYVTQTEYTTTEQVAAAIRGMEKTADATGCSLSAQLCATP